MKEKTERCGNDAKTKKRRIFRIDKKHVQGFLIGMGVCAIAFAGLYFGMDRNFLTGTVSDLNKVTDSNFSEEVLAADRPVVVVVTSSSDRSAISKANLNAASVFANDYGNYCKVVTLNFDNATKTSSQYNIYSTQSLLLFSNGSLIGRKTSVSTEQALMDWVTANVLWEYHAPQQNNTDAVATVYNLFNNGSSYARSNYVDIDVAGEIRLFPFDAGSESYTDCEGQTITGNQYAVLSLTFPAVVNKDSLAVTLPDLTNSEIQSGVNYYVCLDGATPQEATENAATAGNFSYFGLGCDTFDNFYLGEIKLIRNLDESKYADYMVPCDGRTLAIDDYPALYAHLGTVFGGDGTTTFGVPDLRGKSPIDGASYYIMLQGIYMY